MRLRGCLVITRPRCIRWRTKKSAMSVNPSSLFWPRPDTSPRALDRIEIAYEPLETVIDPERAVFKDAPLLHEEAGTNILATREFARGDLAEAMARAAVRVGGRFRFRRKAPVALEPRACLAEYDRGRRSLTLTISTQIPDILRDVLADSSKCRDIASAWRRPTSAAASAAKHPFARRRLLSRCSPVTSAERCAGPAVEGRISSRRPMASTKSLKPNSGWMGTATF